MVDMERRRELAESLQDVLNTPMRRASDPSLVQALRQQQALQRRQRRLVVIMIGGWVVLGWLWIAKPAVVFDPLNLSADTSADVIEAQMRYALYLQASRVVDFAVEQGRVPANLDETGAVEEGLEYLPDSAAWTLRGTVGGQVLELTSRMSADSFLGNSLERLRP